MQQAVRRLVQFTRVRVAPGQPRAVKLHVRPRALSSWSPTEHRWVLGTGAREITVGASSRDIRLRGELDVAG